MAKKRPHHHQLVALSPAEMNARVVRATQEGRFQQALELAKQLFKAEPTSEHRLLLQNTYLGRARQLRSQGMFKDVVTVLNVALQLGDAPAAWLTEVAQELAACGESQQAVNVLRLAGGDPQVEARLLGKSVDRAVEQEARGRGSVPEEWQGDFDCVLRAFAEYEVAKDEAARATLQPIGLRSPFLEWKLLIRGLIAFSQNDDPRALENWQRLSPDRLPARLAAPYRLTIDQGFRLAQSPQGQAALQKSADQLLGDGLIPQLRSIQKYLTSEENFAQAFRLVESILPVVRQRHPQLVTRLASCFYNGLYHDGQPEDIPRYHRIFGLPKDDPGFHRLNALAMEQTGDPALANAAWQNFEKSVVGDPANWPGDQSDHARALIWLRMARNAIAAEEIVQDDPDVPPWERSRPKDKWQLEPCATKCLERSLALAPKLLDAHRELFHYHLENNRWKKAQAAAAKLLENFPDHLETLVQLGLLLQEHENHSEAVKVYERAVRLNPLDRQLRSRLANAHLFAARPFAELGQYDQARANYQAAIALNDPANSILSQAYSKWAACEFKAGDTQRAEGLLRQARDQDGNRLALAFSTLIEVIRFKLPRALKDRFDREFKAALAEPPTTAAAVALVATAATHKFSGVKYTGQKTHEKLLIAYLERTRQLDFNETQLESICGGLVLLSARRVLEKFLAMAKRRFPNNPMFPLCEAQVLFNQKGHRQKRWRIQPLLELALDLARKQQPQDDKQKALIDLIQGMLEVVLSWNPFARLFSDLNPSSIFGAMHEMDGDELDEDETW